METSCGEPCEAMEGLREELLEARRRTIGRETFASIPVPNLNASARRSCMTYPSAIAALKLPDGHLIDLNVWVSPDDLKAFRDAPYRFLGFEPGLSERIGRIDLVEGAGTIELVSKLVGQAVGHWSDRYLNGAAVPAVTIQSLETSCWKILSQVAEVARLRMASGTEGLGGD